MLKEVDLKRAYRATITGLFLISTAKGDKRNVQFAFRALGIWDDPPLVLVGIQNTNYSQGIIDETGEFVLNACSEAQVQAIPQGRVLSGRDVEDKFEALGLKTRPAKHVTAPLVEECFANVECRVLNSMEAGGVKLYVAEPLAVYMDEERMPVARHQGKTWTLQGPLD